MAKGNSPLERPSLASLDQKLAFAKRCSHGTYKLLLPIFILKENVHCIANSVIPFFFSFTEQKLCSLEIIVWQETP